jgi:NADH-quinone oxidoreductase subunit N
MVILSKSTGFINIYLGLELQSIAFYVLATFFLNSKFSVESGIKYFITGSFISCVLLFSFALLYLVTGSLDLECYQNVLVFQYYNLNISLISVVFIIFCLLFKIGCFPFHYILCDVYEGTLITTTLFFSIVPKAVILYVITKLLLVSFINYNAAVQNVLMFLAILSILFTSVNALFQKRIKRLLALSTVAHSGFMLLGVACFSIESIKAIVFYVIPYIVMSFTVFAIIGTSLSKYGFLKYIINWLSFSNKNLLISVMLTICLFSLAGIPPFIGFYSKMLVFIALIKDQHIAVSLIVALLSCLSCFYYIRLIKVLFFQSNGSNVQ